jgi:hypothetical protein
VKVNRFIATTVLLLSAVASANADTLVIASSHEIAVTTVSLRVPAEYVVLPISISSDEKDPLKNVEAVAAARARLTETVSKHPTIKLREGVVSLRVSDAEESAFSYSKSGYPTSHADSYLVHPLGKKNVFQAVREMVVLIRSLSKSDDLRYRLGAATLALEDPERHRPELLGLIAKDIGRTKAALKGARSFELRGLENPVIVTPYDETTVTLHIPYRLSISQ